MSTDEPETPTPDDEAGRAEDQPRPQDETTRAASSPEAGSDSPAEEGEQEPAAEAPAEEPATEEPAPAEEPVAAEPAADQPAPAEEPVAAEPGAEEPAADETPRPDATPVAPADEATREVPSPTDESPLAEPVAESAGATGEPAPAAEEPQEQFEPTPRQKPEIPGADLEPVFVADEEQYLDAEAQAAAEAEAEAEAERRRAEAEDEAAMPIADAAIDLAAGARYTATGKRKTAVARVILKPGTGAYAINGRTLEDFFPRDTLQRTIRQPLETVGYETRMDVIARLHGGGVASQAGALRHGISRALIEADPNLRSELKRRGFLTRDPRVKERKKAGLKKARKRPQFSKR